MPRLGLGLRITKKRLRGGRPPCFDKVVQWFKTPAVNGVLIDKIGSSGVLGGRECVGGWYLSDGTISTGLVSTALTYIDAITGLEVSDTTDGSGGFAVPASGMVSLTIDDHFFPIEETQGDYIGAIDGEYYAVTSPIWNTSTDIESYADLNGYTKSDGVGRYWDDALTILIPAEVIIPIGAGYEEDTDDGYIYETDDDYIYVTSDGYVYVTEES